VVDTSGRVDVSTFKVVRATHDLFATSVRNALPRMRFIPAAVGEVKVRQLVQQPFSFAIVRAAGVKFFRDLLTDAPFGRKSLGQAVMGTVRTVVPEGFIEV
jgi:hypothetical protein